MHQNHLRQEQDNQQLIQQKLGAELQLLKNQLHPHFLFNTLNNLYGMVLTKDEKAPQVVLYLSKMMSYMLYECDVDRIAMNWMSSIISSGPFPLSASSAPSLKSFASNNKPLLPSSPIPLSATRPFIYLKCDREYIKVALDDILYIESLKNHVRLFTTQQKLSTLQSISQIEEKLPQQYFLRIHRSFIVAIHKIDRYSHTQVQVGEYSLPIGRLYKKEVLQRLNEHIL